MLRQFFKWRILLRKFKFYYKAGTAIEDNTDYVENYFAVPLPQVQGNTSQKLPTLNIVTCQNNSSLEIFKKANNNTMFNPNKDKNSKTDRFDRFDRVDRVDRSFEITNSKTPRSSFNNYSTVPIKKPLKPSIKQSGTPSANRSHNSHLKIAEDFSYDNGIATRTPSQLRNTSGNLFDRLYMVFYIVINI